MTTMSPDKNQARYDDILKRIAERKPFGNHRQNSEPATPQDRILDLMNGYDALAALTQRDYADRLCYGPKAIRRAAWSAAVIWYHPKGYYGWQRLKLLGIWAHGVHTDIMLTIGIRQLRYQAPIYNPESYHAAIKRGFRLYYGDNGAPPDEHDRILFQARHSSKERLTHRQTLNDILLRWQRENSS